MSVIGETLFPRIFNSAVGERLKLFLKPDSNLRSSYEDYDGFKEIFSAIDQSGVAEQATQSLDRKNNFNLSDLPRVPKTGDELFAIYKDLFNPKEIGQKLANLDFLNKKESDPGVEMAFNDLVDLAGILAMLRRLPSDLREAYKSNEDFLKRSLQTILDIFRKEGPNFT